MSTSRRLRLEPRPRTESLNVTFACPAGLKADLDRYAALHAQAYGEAVDAATLILHMLETFMGGDRGSKKGQGADLRRDSDDCRCRRLATTGSKTLKFQCSDRFQQSLKLAG